MQDPKHKRNKPHEKADEAALLALRAQGLSNGEIAERVPMSRQRVYQLIGAQPRENRKNASDDAKYPYVVSGTIVLAISGQIKAENDERAEEATRHLLQLAQDVIEPSGLAVRGSINVVTVPA